MGTMTGELGLMVNVRRNLMTFLTDGEVDTLPWSYPHFSCM